MLTGHMDKISLTPSTPKYDLNISPPLMNAAGTLGFVPRSDGRVDLSQFGAFITNPISFQSRSPASTRKRLFFEGGFLLHSGLPNPGFKASIRRYVGRWARSPIPIIIHLLAEEADRLRSMVSRCEGLQGVEGIEIGLPPGGDLQHANELIEAGTGELPLIVRLPVDRADFYLHSLAGAPISAISLGPPRGALADESGQVVSGRLYGPAIFPSMLARVKDVVHSGISIFAAGGVYSRQQVEMLLKFGAAGVQLDSVLWSTGWGYDQG